MVGFAKAHHPSNCLPLNNRNRFGDDGNVASRAATKTKEFTTFYTDDAVIDSVVRDGGSGSGGGGGGGENGPSNCEHWHRQKRQSQHTINGNAVEPNNCRRHHRSSHRRCANVRIYHGNGNRKKTIEGAIGLWLRSTVAKACNLSVSVVLCAAISLLLLNIDVIKAEPQQQTTEQQCEPKVLEETPPDPVSMQSMVIFYFLVSINSRSIRCVFFYSLFTLWLDFYFCHTLSLRVFLYCSTC